jgi:hypothetical protein
MPVGLFNPKPRALQLKVVRILRTDSSTHKCSLPKGAIVVGVDVLQTSNAATAAGAFSLGWSGATTALVNAFSMATTAVGLVKPGTAVGTAVITPTPLDSDKAVISTYTVGSSTAGGEGYVHIYYFMPAPGEDITS